MNRKRKKLSWEDRLFHIGNTAIMILIGIIMVYPLYYIVLASITNPTVVNSGKLLLFPENG